MVDAWPRAATDRLTAEFEVRELQNRHRQAAEMVKSRRSAAAVRHHSITAQKLAEAEKQLAPLRDAGAPSRPGSFQEAENELCRALYDEKVSATGDLKIMGGPLRAVQIPSTAWGPGARIERLASALAAPDRGDTYLNVRLPSTDLDKIWPKVRPQSEEAIGDLGESVTPSGIRTTRAAAAEKACAKWLAGLNRRPKNKDSAFEEARNAVAGPLSRKAFDRVWATEVPSDWKNPGKRKKAASS